MAFPDRVRALAAWTGGGPSWRRLALGAAGGGAAALALPPYYLLPLLVPAFAGLLWLIDGSAGRRRPARAAFAAGWAFGFGFFVAGLYWMTHSLLTDPARFWWLVPLAVPGVSAGLAVFTGLVALAQHLLAPRGLGRVLVFAVLWTLGEWLRGHVLSGFPWNLAGYVWSWSDAAVQPAALFGVWGLSLLTVLAAAMPAVLADPGRGGGLPRPALAGLAAAALVPVLLWAGGAWRLAGAPPAGEPVQPGVMLRLVQPAIDQREKWDPQTRAAHFLRHVEMSRAEGFDGVTHVIWPESASPFDLGRDLRAREIARDAVPPGGLLLAGAPRVDVERRQAWNSLFVLDGRGEVAAVYDKVHLVPFGEYVPLRSVFGIAKITQGAIDFSSGPAILTLDLPGLPPFSPLICYEAIFPGAVLDPGDRPAWLLNVTNDAWFGTSSGPHQHFQAARMRAVEEGLPLVRAANTGISAVIDSYGRVVSMLGLGRRGVVDSTLPAPLAAPTPYGRWGDLIPAVLALALLALGMILKSR